LRTVLEKELRSTQLIHDSIRDCQRAGLLQGIDATQLTYHIVIYVHSWALNTWRFQTPVTREAYVERGLSLLIGKEATKACSPRRQRASAHEA